MLETKKRYKKNKTRGQATLEFAFCFLVVLLIFYSIVKTMQWIGVSLSQTANQHEDMYADGSTTGLRDYDPMDQLKIVDEKNPKMEIVFNGELFD